MIPEMSVGAQRFTCGSSGQMAIVSGSEHRLPLLFKPEKQSRALIENWKQSSCFEYIILHCRVDGWMNVI